MYLNSGCLEPRRAFCTSSSPTSRLSRFPAARCLFSQVQYNMPNVDRTNTPICPPRLIEWPVRYVGPSDGIYDQLELMSAPVGNRFTDGGSGYSLTLPQFHQLCRASQRSLKILPELQGQRSLPQHVSSRIIRNVSHSGLTIDRPGQEPRASREGSDRDKEDGHVADIGICCPPKDRKASDCQR